MIIVQEIDMEEHRGSSVSVERVREIDERERERALRLRTAIFYQGRIYRYIEHLCMNRP